MSISFNIRLYTQKKEREHFHSLSQRFFIKLYQYFAILYCVFYASRAPLYRCCVVPCTLFIFFHSFCFTPSSFHIPLFSIHFSSKWQDYHVKMRRRGIN